MRKKKKQKHQKESDKKQEKPFLGKKRTGKKKWANLIKKIVTIKGIIACNMSLHVMECYNLKIFMDNYCEEIMLVLYHQ